MRRLRSFIAGGLCVVSATLIFWLFDPAVPYWGGLLASGLGGISGMRNGACAAYAFFLGLIAAVISLFLVGLVFSPALFSFVAIGLCFGAGWMLGYGVYMARIDEALNERINTRTDA